MNQDTDVKIHSQFLEKQKIALICGGGIAAIEAPRLARELRRHGASIQFFVTESCLKFVGIESLRWSSQSEVIVNPSGLAEHICTSDAVVIAPATADLISKATHGICSDGATTLIQSALGLKKPVLFCPTMHNSMFDSPIVKRNCETLQNLEHVFFMPSRKEEGKEKLQEPNLLAMDIAYIINKKRLHKKERNLLLTFGGTRTKIDPARCITNLSTGNLGLSVLNYFYGMGVTPTVFSASTTSSVPNYAHIKKCFLPEYNDFLSAMKKEDLSLFDGLIHILAASDFTPTHISENKIESNQSELVIKLSKTKKIIDEIDLQKLHYKAAAKLTSMDSQDGVVQAKSMLNKYKLNAIFWNSIDSAWTAEEPHSGIFIQKNDAKISEEKTEGKIHIAKCFYQSFIKAMSEEKGR